MKKIRYWLAGAVIFIVLIIFLMPVEITDTVMVQGKILAAEEWIMIRQADGSMMISQRNNRTDMLSDYSAFQIDRGDVFQFILTERLTNDRNVHSGDTLGLLYSDRLFQEISRIEGLIDIAKANQLVTQTGEKEEIISQARDEYKLNVERASVQTKILERQTKLYKDALISNEEFEITRGLARIAELEVQVSEARLKSLMTGEKPAEIERAASEIFAARIELDKLKNKLNRFALISPFSGEISTLFSSDTVLVVNSMERIVFMLVPYEYFASVHEGQSYIAHNIALNKDVAGQIVYKSNNLKVLGSGQVFFAVGTIDEDVSSFPLNMIIQCDINAKPKPVSDYLLIFIKTLFW